MRLALVAVLAGCALPPALPLSQHADVNRLTTALATHPLALLGEVHDNAAQHALRLQAVRAHLAGGARPALLMEQFDREHQAAIDTALAAPGASADSVIDAGAPDPQARRGWDWRHYAPYITLAIEYRLPLIAANVSRADARRAMREGLAALGFDAAVPDDIVAAQAQAIADGHCGAIDAAQARPLVAAQVARDQFMARALQAHAARGALLLAGNGHVRTDIGVPRWLPPGLRSKVLTVGLLEPGPADAAPFDLVIRTAAQPRTDPCKTAARYDRPSLDMKTMNNIERAPQPGENLPPEAAADAAALSRGAPASATAFDQAGDLVGCFDGGPKDLATDPKHLQDLGKV